MRYSKSAHTRFYHRFHVVWATKYRYKVLQGPMRGIRPVSARFQAFSACQFHGMSSSRRLIL